ncbi:MAG: endonuclease Q family protein [Nanoarchaeota archaeon]
MIIADLQIHSRFARACSKQINLDYLEKYARIKGLNLLGTGDFQHPTWNKEIKENLKEDDNGILWSKNKFPFLWQTEVSLIYSDNGKRAVHLLIFSPNQEISDQVIEVLGKKGRLDYDGRPIFGMTCVELVEIMKEISDDIEIIPAHCMTSWFGIYGSKSGFDSLKDCFKDKVNKIYAIESGMSANPPMLWRMKENVNIVSFSDAHSFWPFRLGREVTMFDCDLKYKDIIRAIRVGKGLNGTIEVNPEYGKYHIDGHRNCDFSCDFIESKKLDKICPKCGKELTIGVGYRVEELAKEEKGYRPEYANSFIEVIPLQELIGKVYDIKQLNSKKNWEIYNKLIKEFKNEFNVLLNVSKDDLNKVVPEKMSSIIIKNRENRLRIKPGYDGVYGEIELEDNEKIVKQKKLGEF